MKDQINEQAGQQDVAAPTTQTEDPTFGLRADLYAQIMQLSPADSTALAEMMENYPSFMGKILMVAAPRVGNAAVQRAIATVKQMRSVSGASGTLGKEETRESLHEPADSLPVKSNEMVATLHDASDGPLATEPAAAPKPVAAEPPWVVSARAYNTAHPDLVDEFDELTHNAVLLDGDTDPRAVVHWQKANGLDADGKIGPRTIAKAREVKAKSPERAAAPAPAVDARPPV
jgi:hypothetical protein